MPGSQYELSDISVKYRNEDLASATSVKKEGGMHISTAKGFILAFLAIAVAVGVGIIVHFAGPGSKVECTCNTSDTGGITAALEGCKKLATGGNTEICSACPSQPSFATCPPTLPAGTVTTTTGTTSGTGSTPAPPVTDVRLPLSLEPLLYTVELQPNMYAPLQPDQFTFSGSVKILLHCRENTQVITLHSNKLNITGAISVVEENGVSDLYQMHEFDLQRQFLKIHTNQPLAAGRNYTVDIRAFVGPLVADLAGLYLSSYTRGNETIGDGWFADKFQRTPKMSTYLLAFIICDFQSIENTTKKGVTYRAWSRPEAIDQAPYSLQVGVDILDYFEEYFNVTYPLPKQDMIAIPDFAAGAMENWGLITYRETAMLYEPGVSSEGNKQRVAIVVSHELAHQWFGNLVTPSWWDDLWLNEGFASYVEYMGVDFVHPDWKMFEQFVVIDLQDVFNFDGLISSHPVYVPVAHPDEINEIFDRISYGKGASIIRMMRFFLGDNTFQKGLTKYLRQLAYGAAFHDDLWYALGNQSIADNNVITDVKAVMDTWTLQMNYPVVMVTFDRQGQITLKQSRYLRDPNATDPGIYTSPFGYKWDIPFTYTTSNDINFNVTSADVKLMSRTSGEIMITDQNIPAATGNNWVIGNPMQYGYYRVNYDVRNWNALIEQLKLDHTVIHPINRAQIINDAWNLARSGELDMTTALRTTEYLDMEREYVPWSAASSELAFVRTMLERNPLYGSYQKFMQNKTTSVFKDITMNNTGATHLQSYIRSLTSSLACTYGIKECIDESKTLFARWMSDPQTNPIDPGLKSTVYCTAIAEGGVEEWEFALAQYKSANLAAEKSRLQSALACTKEIWILSKYLEMSINPDEIRRQDAVSAIVSIANNIIGRDLAWSFFVSNWDFLLNDFGAGSFAFSSLIGGITSSYNSQLDFDELTEFINSKDDLGSGQRAFAQALEKTQSNINWMDANVPVIESWLREQGY